MIDQIMGVIIDHYLIEGTLIAGSPPILLSLIVGRIKCDAQASVTRQNLSRKSPNLPGYPAFG